MSSRAVIFTRGAFGPYGLGRIEITEEGIEIDWWGILFRVRPQTIPWVAIKSIQFFGSRMVVREEGRIGNWSFFVWNGDRVAAECRMCAPSSVELL